MQDFLPKIMIYRAAERMQRMSGRVTVQHVGVYDQAKARKMLGEPAMAKRWTSQITPPSPAVRGEATPVSQSGFRRLVPGKGQNLTLLSIELHADTRWASSIACISTLASSAAS